MAVHYWSFMAAFWICNCMTSLKINLKRLPLRTWYIIPWKYKCFSIKSLSPMGLVWIDTRRHTHSAQSFSMYFLCYSCTNTMIKNMSFYITWYIIPWKYKCKLPHKKFGFSVSTWCDLTQEDSLTHFFFCSVTAVQTQRSRMVWTLPYSLFKST